MKALLAILIVAVLILPFVVGIGRQLRVPKYRIHFYGQRYKTFKLSELDKAKRFAKLHPYLKFAIECDGEVITMGATKQIHQISLTNKN
jgi:hypothetical protein